MNKSVKKIRNKKKDKNTPLRRALGWGLMMVGVIFVIAPIVPGIPLVLVALPMLKQ